MVKRIGRRFVSLLLTFVTILTLLPAMTLPALAASPTMPAGLTELKFHDLGTTGFPSAEDIKTDIGINEPKFDGGATINGKEITITAKGTNRTGCSHKNATVTLTLTNSHATTATLTFKNNSVAVKGVDGSSVSGSIATIPYNGSIEVSVTSKAGTQVSGTFTVTGLEFEVNTLTTTFLSGENGSYTIRTDKGDELTPGMEYTKPSTVRYRLEPKPNAGYALDRWIDFDTKETLSTSQIYETSGGSKIAPVFAPIGCARYYIVGVSKIEYSYLDEAIAAAGTSGTIVAASDGTVFGSKGQKTFTIPSGVTLLIPFDGAGTVYREKPDYVGAPETQKAYKTLTMPSGSSIEVYGAISVGGKHFAGSSSSCCKTTGQYGQIIMQEDSSITLYNGANLYAWGYITGDGKITATSGSTVYEYFQVTDWRGGTATFKMIGNDQKVFPFSQYYVQNIEAPLTIQHGATEKAYFSVNAQNTTIPTTIDFIGTKGLFQLQSGSITKKYVPATGRTEYTTNGTASLEHLAVEMKLGLITYTIDSMDYALPINGNMTLNIASGKVTSNFDLCLLPGVQINIAKDAELEVAASLYVYDSAEWGDYCQCKNKRIADVDYSPTLGRYVRTVDDLVDAKIDLNGKLTAIGSVYTTQSGANICSSEGGGRFVQQNAPGQEKTTHQVKKQAGSLTDSTEYYDIPITPAQLKNKDGAPTLTAGSKTGDTFTYCKCQDCGDGTWVKDVAAIINNGTQGDTYSTLEAAVKAYSPDNNTAPTNYIKLLHNTTEKTISVNNKSLYLDLNGRTVTGDISVTGTHKLYGMDSSAKADYTTAPTGKIVGTVKGCAPTYQTPGDTNDRYVAIQGKEADNETENLSFHRFNISVTGYRFELATGGTPECALFFIGKFQGDDAAKNHLTELGFTLKGDNDKLLGEANYEFIAGTVFPPMPAEGEVIDSKVVRSGDDFLFEVYLKRSFDKEKSDGYTENISATARAKFDNGGEQQSDPQALSFQEAWQNAEISDSAQQEILDNFLQKLGITKQAE